jgi:hypothetical protein
MNKLINSNRMTQDVTNQRAFDEATQYLFREDETNSTI